MYLQLIFLPLYVWNTWIGTLCCWYQPWDDEVIILKINIIINPYQGRSLWLPRSFLLVALKRQKILPNASVIIIVSSTFAVILPQHIRGLIFNGVMVSRQKSKVVGSLRHRLYFSIGKAQKWGFSCFSERILAKFVLCKINFDEIYAQMYSHTYHNHISTHFGHTNGENPWLWRFLTLFAILTWYWLSRHSHVIHGMFVLKGDPKHSRYFH